MARSPYVLPELERLHGDLNIIIPETVNKFNGNQRKAADYLQISPATISRWLCENDYSRRVVWEKKA